MVVIVDIDDYINREIGCAKEHILENQEIIIETQKQIIYWDARMKAMQDIQKMVKIL